MRVPRPEKHVNALKIKNIQVSDTMFGKVDTWAWLIVNHFRTPEKNTANYCQLCCRLEDILGGSSCNWKDQPASYNLLNGRY